MRIYILPNFYDFAVNDKNIAKDINKAYSNFESIIKHAKNAKSSGFYLEYIVLLTSFIEYYLRMYIFEKINKSNPFVKRLELGKLLELINKDKNDFNLELYNKLVDFKSFRNDTIHNLLFGFYDFQEIKIKIEDFKNIGNEIFNFVIQTIGKPYDEINFIDNPGNIIATLK
jgi:hypothetical protein